MTKESLLAEILRLSPEDRIDLLGAAWDSIRATPDEVPVPDWHLAVLRHRLSNEKPEYVPWDEVYRRLKESQQQ
ncbi:MAG: addiction module protein [Gemmatimonadota bacterium]